MLKSHNKLKKQVKVSIPFIPGFYFVHEAAINKQN